MYIRAAVSVALIALASRSVWAQDSLVGKYTGNYEVQVFGTMYKIGMIVTISSVENGVVTGSATNESRTCGGEYPFRGTVKGDELVLISDKKGGRAGDCTFRWRAKIEGNKLVGQYGPSVMELSK